MSINLIPVGPRVLIRPDDPIAKTDGGLVLPDKAQKQVTRGTVLAVGEPEEGFAPLLVEVGDRVLYSPYAFNEVKEGKETLVLIHVRDIFAREPRLSEQAKFFPGQVIPYAQSKEL